MSHNVLTGTITREIINKRQLFHLPKGLWKQLQSMRILESVSYVEFGAVK